MISSPRQESSRSSALGSGPLTSSAASAGAIHSEHRRHPATVGRRPSILYVCAVGGHGGPVQSLFTVLPGMNRYERRLIGSWSADSLERLHREHLAEEIALLERPRGPAILRVVARLVLRCVTRARRPTIIHANGLTELVVSLPAALLGKIPILVWVHNSECPRSARLLAPVIRAYSRRLQWAAVSSLAKQVVVDAGLARADQVEIVPNPIAPAVVSGRTEGNGRVRIGYLGTTRHHKGFALLPAIIQRLENEPVQWLLYTSSGKGGDDVWEKIRQHPSERVEVRGRVADVGQAYAECDIVFVPSLQESFCRVAAEAMLNGIPVVASDLRPLEDLLGPGEAGLTFPAGDSGAAAEALRALIHDADRRRRMGEEGRRRARAFMPEAITGALLRKYLRITPDTIQTDVP